MGTAYAQSNVTLYGLIDESLNYVSNEGGHSAFTQTSGNVQGSRWGIKGTEDLGGGYQAIFTLENGFALNNGALGQGGLEFGRQAFVGLTTPAGTITLGRQYDFLIYLYSMTNLYSAGTYGFHLGDYDRLGGERLNNVIAYQSPTFGGLKFGALYAPGGQPGHLAAGSAQSYGVSYSRGNLNLAAAYTSVNNTTITPATTIGVPDLFGTPQSGTIAPRPDVDRRGGRQLSVRARAAAWRVFAHRHEERRFDRRAKYVGGRCNLLADARGIGAGRLRVLEAE
jgi:outer membrane protein OmpU